MGLVFGGLTSHGSLTHYSIVFHSLFKFGFVSPETLTLGKRVITAVSEKGDAEWDKGE